MRKRLRVPDDPVVREVRQVRQTLWREAGQTTDGLLELLDRLNPIKPKRHRSRPGAKPKA